MTTKEILVAQVFRAWHVFPAICSFIGAQFKRVLKGCHRITLVLVLVSQQLMEIKYTRDVIHHLSSTLLLDPL